MSSSIDRRSVLAGALGLVALGGVSALAGCSAQPTTTAPAPSGDGKVLTVDTRRQAMSISQAPDLAQVVAGMATFGQSLHGATATSGANWTASPLSLAVAFGMLRAGARGNTARQLDAALGFPPSSNLTGSPHAALNALTAELVTTDPVSTTRTPPPDGTQAPAPIVAVANALFVDTTFVSAVQPDYLQLLASQYGSHLTAVSFADPSALATINAWVATQTRDRIRVLFDQLDPATQLVLANAVYLKATWTSQFEESQTSTVPFRTGAATVSAHMMRQTLDHAAYHESADWQAVSLPYVGDELSMRIVLPRKVVTEVTALGALLPIATDPSFGGTSRAVELSLPRWDTATNIPLLTALTHVGVTDLTDLRGIAPGLAVSDAIHRANITVDESGTEAAAVTGIAMLSSGILATPLVMTVDRPFAWAVVHDPTGTPLFTGHVVDPTA